MYRNVYNGSLSIKDVNKEVELVGWVSKRRNLGQILFIDLRDRSGIVQVLVNEGIKCCEIRNEYVIQVKGVVKQRKEANNKLKTGEIEVIASEVNLINSAFNPPLIIDDKTDALEDTRLKYRYLDLRRPIMQHYLDIRHQIKMSVHEYLNKHHFIEIETPMLCASSPEGAKEYLVPSRIHHGNFYALPQSPQMFKQMLMIGGLERYYQIARCFRDEDLRADRQPDFTQIDIETSFLSQDELLELMEGLLYKIFKDTINVEIKLPLRQIKYETAIKDYGSDKPDTRFDMKLFDVDDLLNNINIPFYNKEMSIRAIKVENIAHETTRKIIDSLNLEAKKFSLDFVNVLKYEQNQLHGSLIKYLDENTIKQLIQRSSLKENDILIISHGPYNRVCSLLGNLRNQYAKKLGLIKPNTYDLLWVVDFPMFELNVEDNKIVATHHPFTRPKDECLKTLKSDPLSALSYAYDIVINGYEAGGGTLRIYDQNIQKEIFEILGLSDEEIKNKFGYFIEALKYGTPPHGGIAFGLDRLAMILGGTDNIRDVIAFPKNLSAVDPVSMAPNKVDQSQLDELGIIIKDN